MRAAAVLDFTERSGHYQVEPDGVFPSFFEHSGMCLARVDSALRVRAANQEFCDRFGTSAVDARGRGIADFVHPGGRELVVLIEPDGAAAADATVVLSVLDARILEGVAAGVSTVRLAAKLYLSRQGIEYRVGVLLRRLRVPNRAALVSKAHSVGLLSTGTWPPHVLPATVG
jgi:DNA-binding NarL/FixJ family response regulator